MPNKVELVVTGTVSSIGLFAVDELPGWSDLPPLAKVSIIATLLVLVALVVVSLMLMLAWERKANMIQVKSLIDSAMNATEQQRVDFVDEVANSRSHHSATVERVCLAFEKSAGVAHSDSQAILDKLEQTRESNEQLRVHCASVLAIQDRDNRREE